MIIKNPALEPVVARIAPGRLKAARQRLAAPFFDRSFGCTVLQTRSGAGESRCGPI
jgi:hypothetical protein